MKIFKKLLPWTVIACLAVIVLWNYTTEIPAVFSANKEQETESKLVKPKLAVDDTMSKQETKAARAEYFFRLLRDPATNRIPPNIRARELTFAKQLPKREDGFAPRLKTQTAIDPNPSPLYNWNSVGPQDVGGRTRALGIDQRDPNIIIAGGVSGGIWKSTDGGDSWAMKSDPGQNMSVSYLTQDPTNPDTWYYASGEFLGNSASDRGGRASYRGTGVFKTTDNGETWARLSSTADTDVSFDTEFDYISRIIVSPTTGSVFIASNGFGIYRSTDDGGSWSSSPILGVEGEQQFADVNVAPDGTLVAVISEATFGSGTHNPGVFVSTDDGDSWSEYTPNTFPSSHQRSVAAFAPSDPSIFYVFTYKGSGSNQAISFHKFTLNSSASDTLSTEDRSANIPDFGGSVGGMNVQGGYNMVVSVKPDNPDAVFVGGTNLFRSMDGFATAPPNEADSTKAAYWIGGYARSNDVSQYPNQHPDQHVLAYHPTNPDTVWSGHDGGLSLTEAVVDTPVTWTDRDDGYITSQFYTVALDDDTTNVLIGGGTQDNGSPFIEIDNSFNQIGTSVDASSGDGGYAFFRDSLLFTSSQRGRVNRFDLDQSGTYNFTAYVHPQDAQSQLFIHPYAVDPNNGSIMYYPDVNSSGTPRMFVNTEVDEITNTSNPGGATQGWNSIDLTDADGMQVTALEVSRRPENILYYAAYSSSDVPKIFKATDASGAFNVTEITIGSISTDTHGGAYVHDIAINPIDADEALVVMSNYEITGIYHTTDGGATWNAVEGNLSDDDAGNTGEGPSIRSATIMPTGTSTIYMVGTSIGLCSTDALDGSNTTWVQEASGSLGNAVTEYVTSRITDGMVAAGSHGRGIFLGEFTGEFSTPGPPSTPSGLMVSAALGSTELDWEQNPEVDIDSYNIYKGSQPNALTLLTNNVTQTSYSDTSPDSTTTYYAVSAVDNDGNVSSLTRPIAALRRYRTVDTNWRLVGSPMQVPDHAALPEDLNIYSFDGTYEIPNQVEEGRGYWVKHTEPDSIHYFGGARSSRQVQMRAGWNLISGVGDTLATSEIQDPDGILSNTPVQTYAGGNYQDVTDLIPTGGYFIHAQQEGQIILRVDTSSSAPKANPNRLAQSSEISRQELDEIRFSGNGITKTLLVSRKSLTAEQKQLFLVPPKAPESVLDVRTRQGYDIVDQNKTDINLTSFRYPLQVQLAPNTSEGTTYRLVGITNGDEVYFDLEPGKAVTIDKSFDRLMLTGLEEEQIPLANELMPNYPNPFNPSTTIEYRIKSQSLVRMEVYNLIGRKVHTLVNKVQEAGNYTVTFNASNLSSGTYFVRIQAGDFQKVQKMTLIK